MISTATRRVRWLRVLLCASSLLGGACLAELTRPRSRDGFGLERPGARAPKGAPARATAASAATTRRELAPLAIGRSTSDEPSPDPRSEEAALGAAYKDGLTITGTTHRRLILFTFDDGPDPRTTPLLLDRLDEAGIKAVFFLVASRIASATPIQREQAQLAREIVRRGHLVGGHTVDHVQLPLLDDAAVKQQLRGQEEIFEQALGGRPYIFRPPFGAHSQRIDQLAAQRGYTTVLWSLGGEDFQVRTAEDVYQTWLRGFEHRRSDDGRGGVILLHDTHPWSVDAFQMIVAHLMARNCELLDRREELFDIVDDLSFFFTPRGGAVAEAEAPPADLDPAVLEQRQTLLRERTARRCKSMARAY
jgi:peptidoglycan/xylan/chitin deacetylase (PgdA/CDA1 family)